MTTVAHDESDAAVLCRVSVEDYRVQALIGVHAHEFGRRQLLVVTVMLDVELPGEDSLEQTIDYTMVAAAIERTGDTHIRLIECFAAQVARACLAVPLVNGARVRVEKPSALAGGLACSEVEMRRVARPCARPPIIR